MKKVGHSWLGKLKSTVDKTLWSASAGVVGWDDGGAVEAEIAGSVKRIKRILSDQVREAVGEYATDGEFAMRCEGGQLYVGFRQWDAAGIMICEVPLTALINAAAAEAMASAGTGNSQEFLTAASRLSITLQKALMIQQSNRSDDNGRSAERSGRDRQTRQDDVSNRDIQRP